MTTTDQVDLVKLYDVEGREFVASADDVPRRLAEGYLEEKPGPESDPDRVTTVQAVHHNPAVPDVALFDPAEHTVPEVKAYLEGLSADDAGAAEYDRVFKAEQAGENRKGIVGGD